MLSISDLERQSLKTRKQMSTATKSLAAKYLLNMPNEPPDCAAVLPISLNASAPRSPALKEATVCSWFGVQKKRTEMS